MQAFPHMERLVVKACALARVVVVFSPAGCVSWRSAAFGAAPRAAHDGGDAPTARACTVYGVVDAVCMTGGRRGRREGAAVAGVSACGHLFPAENTDMALPWEMRERERGGRVYFL